MSHLTHNQRLLIENGLRNGKSFKEISAQIGKSHTTVSREVLRHRVDSGKGAFGRLTNRCVHARLHRHPMGRGKPRRQPLLPALWRNARGLDRPSKGRGQRYSRGRESGTGN